MKKSFGLYALVWAIFLAIFNVFCFAIPAEAGDLNKFGGAFWVGYAFITLAFVGQLICTYFAFRADSLKKLFYSLPLISISYTGLVLMLVFGAAAMAIPNLPNWAGAIVCLLIFAFTAVAVIKAQAAAGAVADIDSKVAAQTRFVKSMTADAEGLLARAGSDEIKAACKKVYEAARYADPMSTSALADVEAKIASTFAELSAAVAANDTAAVTDAAETLVALFGDRSRQCKSMK